MRRRSWAGLVNQPGCGLGWTPLLGAVFSRIGVGRIRHWEVKVLWTQELVQKGRVLTKTVDGDVADLGD